MFRFIKKKFYLINFLSFSVSFSMEKQSQCNQMQEGRKNCDFIKCEEHKKALIQYKENAQLLFGATLDRISQNLTNNKDNLLKYISSCFQKNDLDLNIIN